MSYAALDMSGDRLDILWSREDCGRATVYLNRKILRTVALPMEGAQQDVVCRNAKRVRSRRRDRPGI